MLLAKDTYQKGKCFLLLFLSMKPLKILVMLINEMIKFSTPVISGSGNPLKFKYLYLLKKRNNYYIGHERKK